MGLGQCGIFGEESERDFRELQVDNEGSRNVIRSERSAGKRGHGKDEKYFSQWLPPLQHRGGIRRCKAALDSGILRESVCKRDENAGRR